jgi:HAD superfamily hydrolase (TIGR01549 family)
MAFPEDPAFPQAKAGVKAIFFDLDGTLVDTDDAFLEALASRLDRWSRLFRRGDPRPTLRRVALAAERPVNAVVTVLDTLGLDDNVFSIGDRLRRLRGLRVQGHFVPVDGVLQALRELQQSYRLGLITTRSRADARSFISQFDLSGVLEVVVTREDTRRLKPHPEPVRRAVGSLSLLPSQCVMVGDTVVDVVSAKAAGAYAIGVLCGFGERAELVEAGADLILETTSQLVDWL